MFELAATKPSKQAAKVFESYFGNTISFDNLNVLQTKNMLKRVRATIAEHRRTPEFHHSEQNPAYLKLVVMEQALEVYINGHLMKTRMFSAPPKDVKGDIYPSTGTEINVVFTHI
jgi:hypothetical protein